MTWHNFDEFLRGDRRGGPSPLEIERREAMSELYNPSSIFDFKSLRTVVKYGDLEILTNDADTIFFRCGGMGIAYHQKVNAWSSPLDWPEHSGVSDVRCVHCYPPSVIPMAHEPKHEPFLIIESGNGQWKCNGCGTWYEWSSLDEDVLEHCPKCCGTKIKCPMAHENKTATEAMIRQANETLEFPPPMEGQDSWGIHDRNGNHVATIPCKGSIKSPITGEWEQRVSPLNWYCANHPPGSEVEVKKGEACYCGNKEAN